MIQLQKKSSTCVAPAVSSFPRSHTEAEVGGAGLVRGYLHRMQRWRLADPSAIYEGTMEDEGVSDNESALLKYRCLLSANRTHHRVA